MGFESRCAGRSENDFDFGRNGDGRLPVLDTDGAGGVAPDRRQFRPMSDER